MRLFGSLDLPAIKLWCANLELNQDSADYESEALPLSYWRIILVPHTGIEPALSGVEDRCIIRYANEAKYIVDPICHCGIG